MATANDVAAATLALQNMTNIALLTKTHGVSGSGEPPKWTLIEADGAEIVDLGNTKGEAVTALQWMIEGARLIRERSER